MELTTAAELARQLLQLHHLKDWQFRFNRRKRALGLCRYETRWIELSLPFTRANSETAVRDTLLHEVAHALAGRAAGHGPVWKAICRRIGATPERCDHSAIMPAGRWRAACPCCGRTYTRHRRPLRRRRYFCRHCGEERGRVIFRLHIPTPKVAAKAVPAAPVSPAPPAVPGRRTVLTPTRPPAAPVSATVQLTLF